MPDPRSSNRTDASGDDRPPLRGDEARLFDEFSQELVRRISAAVRTSRDNAEDACSFAWVQFLRHQPDRDRNWRAWLTRTAEREAWRLDGESRRQVPVFGGTDLGEERYSEAADPRDRYVERVELREALELLQPLPARLRRIVFLRAAGLRYSELMEVTGDSHTRVNQLLKRARQRIDDQLAERSRAAGQTLPVRAQRLQELQTDPPQWLLGEIGPAPKKKSFDRRGQAGRLLAWQQAVLAMDDYRRAHGVRDEVRALGDPPHEPSAARAYELAARAVERARPARAREASKELGR